MEMDVLAEVERLVERMEDSVLFDILEMPFLESMDTADAAALRSLADMARDNPAELADVFRREMIGDGIDDGETPVIAALAAESMRDPIEYEELLTPSVTRVEDRWVELPLSGGVRLSIVRGHHGYGGSMDRLENVVRNAESTVGRPFPTSFVSLVFSPNLSPGAEASFDGDHVSLRVEYDRAGS